MDFRKIIRYIKLRTGRNSQPLARMEFSSTEMKDHVVSIDPSVFKDTKTFVFIVFTQAENVQFDSWQFSESDASGIATISDRSQTPLPSAQYDLNGHRLSDANHHGLVIERYQDVNGTTRTRKHIK